MSFQTRFQPSSQQSQASRPRPIWRTASALLLLFSAGSAAGFDISPGKAFPSLTLPTASEGKMLSTDTFLGKKSLVHIFGSW